MKYFFIFCLLVLSALNADSLNSPLKNPSMGVIGTPREATPIVVPIIRTELLSTACNSNTDTIAVTPDRSMMLICYSNIWVQQQ